MGPIGPTELIIVLVIVLVIFGPKRLPSLGRSLGSGLREFKDSVTSRSGDDDADSPALETGEPETSAVAPPAKTDAADAFGEPPSARR